MNSLDTNVLARFFIDDPDDAEAVQQRPAAVSALSQRAMVTVTVLLKFEWIMLGFYRLARADIMRVLSALMGIGHITTEDREAVTVAMSLFERGMDLADALHLARSDRATAFATFDRKLDKRAKALGCSPVFELLS